MNGQPPSPPVRLRAHHQIKVKRPWYDSLAEGVRNFYIVEDVGFVIGDVIHFWECEDTPSPDGPVTIYTGKRLARQVNFVLNAGPAHPGLVSGWAVVGVGPVKSSGSGNAGAQGIPAIIPLRQPMERLAA